MKVNTQILQHFKTDPRAFFKFLQVMDKEKGALVPFVLNSEQEELLDVLLTKQKVIVLKARQIGCSTLLRAYFLWRTYCSGEPTTHAIISYTRDSADHLHSMDKQFYISLPKALQRKLSKSSNRTLQFADSKANLRSFTAGGKAGATRSFTFNSCHISEFAFFDDQEDLLSNVIASVGEGQIVIETTPNIPGDKYHDLIMNSHHNGWHLCFFPWYKHKNYRKKSRFHLETVPDMDENELEFMEQFGLNKAQMYWRRTKIASIGLDKFRREFPSTVDEAFLSTSNLFFPTDVIDALELIDTGRGPHHYYAGEARGDDQYAMGVDVASGTGGDYSTITVVSRTTKQPVYHYRCNEILPHNFADVVWEKYHEFGEPITIVEQNGVGEVVISRLQEWRLRNLWRDDRGKYWRTNKHNKISIYDNLRDILCNEEIVAISKLLWSELRTVEVTDNGVPNAVQKGTNDDIIISTALALWICKIKPAPSFFQVRRDLIDEFKRKTRANRIRNAGPLPWRPAGGFK
jgi:hypothetical protein